MKTYCVAIFCFLSLLFVGCNKRYSDIETAGLKGKVKSVREITYQAIGNQDTLVKGDIVMAEDIPNYYITYNEFGNTLDMFSYDNSNELLFRWHYTYDKDNQTLSAIYMDKYNEVLDSTYYVYDDKGNEKEYYHYDADGNLCYKMLQSYDRKGNCMEQKSINVENLIIRDTKCKYKGKNLVEDASYDGDNHLIMYSKYTYDKHNNLKTQAIYNADSSINTQGFYDYNENQDIIRSVTKVPQTPDVEYTYKYTYDKKGNWTQKITSLNGEVILLTIRQIEYYN